METREFKRGIEALISRARMERTAFICAERLPWKCHRRFIAFALEKRGWKVTHLIEKGETWTPGGIAKTMSLFDTHEFINSGQ